MISRVLRRAMRPGWGFNTQTHLARCERSAPKRHKVESEKEVQGSTAAV